MDWYSIFKFLHIAAAICWVGGGVVLMYLGILATRARDDDRAMTVIKLTASLALVWFVPASLSTVVFGAIATTIGGLWADAWISLGLLGFLATFVTGNFVIRPSADAVAKYENEGKRAVALSYGNKLLAVSKFDYVMLFTVIADMAFKPQWSDVAVLAVMAVVLLIGAGLFLVPALRLKVAA